MEFFEDAEPEIKVLLDELESFLDQALGHPRSWFFELLLSSPGATSPVTIARRGYCFLNGWPDLRASIVERARHRLHPFRWRHSTSLGQSHEDDVLVGMCFAARRSNEEHVLLNIGHTPKRQTQGLDLLAYEAPIQMQTIKMAAITTVIRGQAPSQPRAPLTLREIEILTHTSLGKTYSQIAAEINISCSTVKFHIRNILKKMDARNTRSAIRRALEANVIVEIDDK